MKRIYLFLLFIVTIYAQGIVAQDTTSFLDRAEQYIRIQRFAAAHKVYQDAIQTIGFQPIVICPMVENVLKHHFWQQDFSIFYLADSITNQHQINPANLNHIEIVSFYFPDRVLKKAIERYPQYAMTYKLLGDYYRLKIELKSNSENREEEKSAALQEKVFNLYYKATQLGFSSTEVNRWLGQYYFDHHQYKVAKQFLLNNDINPNPDAISFLYLSKIFYQEKQYSQAYNYALKALQNQNQLSLYSLYQATHLAALSLYNLGEESRFLDYILSCIQLFPDNPEAYLDLFTYYEETEKIDRIKDFIRQLLMNNPYDEASFKYLEKFCVKYHEYEFGISLFEDMMVQYEYSDEAMGNIYRFRGNLMFHQGDTEQAKKFWDVSRSYFIRYLPEDHPKLKQIGDISQESTRK